MPLGVVVVPDVRLLVGLTEIKRAIPALALLAKNEMNAKELALALEISEETSGLLREHFRRLGLVMIKEVPAGGATALTMSLTEKGRRAAKCVLELARALK